MYSRSILRSTHLKPHKHPPILLRSSSLSILPWTARKSSSYTPYQRSRGTVRTQSSINFTAAVVVVATSLLAGSIYFYQHPIKPQPGESIESSEGDANTEEHAIMAGTPLPGRPGNLTPEQEVKLQEMWTATLKVFGVPVLAEQTNGDGASTTGSESLERAEKRSRAGTHGSEKKKKSRLSLFSRKNHDDPSGEDADGVSTIDGEDKYGQTKEFYKVLDSQSPEDLRTAFWSMVKHDNPDALLLRFLRARKWNVQNALIMLIATMHWRGQEMHVDDDIMTRGEVGAAEDSKSSNGSVKREGHDFLAQMRLGKSFLHGTDREGRPMCFVRVRLHKQGEQTEPSLERYTVYTIETARLLLHSNIDTAAIVFDMTDFSMANMDYGPVKFMIKVFEANYPESLGVVLVHKSPWIFQSIWKIIKGWLDPVVASKIHFTRNTQELEEFIERKHITKELGGDDPWDYHYIEATPDENKLLPDDATKQKLLDERAAVVKEYETTTQQWIKASESRETLQQERTKLAERLKSGYWELDPYLRAKSFYDRTGMINEGGRIQFYTPPTIPAALNGTAPAQNEPIPIVTGAAPAQNGPIPAGHRDDDLD